MFSILYKKTNIVFEQCEYYQKGSFRNRCLVAGSSSVVSLTVPLVKGRYQRTPITEVRIDNSVRWQERHWRTLESCYRKAPWFDHYAPGLEEMYRTRYELLAYWDLDLFHWVLSWLNWNKPVNLTGQFLPSYADPGTLDLRSRILPRTYTRFPSTSYQQVFSDRTGFLPNLSIIDLLFCMGTQATSYLAAQAADLAGLWWQA